MSRNSLQDLKSKKFYLALFCEFIGTMFLVLVACGSCGSKAGTVQISLCFGFSVATIVWTIAHISGGHINPAVTIGFFVTRKISLLRFILYVICQTVGAIVGAYVLKALTPVGANDGLGSTLLGANVSVAAGFFIELLITFILVWTVFATCDTNRQGPTGSGPLAIGLSIAMCHLWAIPYTGSAMNPARAFGSHVASRAIEGNPYIWLYWIGPLLGGAVAALLYDLLMAGNAGMKKCTGFFSRDYDEEDYINQQTTVITNTRTAN